MKSVLQASIGQVFAFPLRLALITNEVTLVICFSKGIGFSNRRSIFFSIVTASFNDAFSLSAAESILGVKFDLVADDFTGDGVTAGVFGNIIVGFVFFSSLRVFFCFLGFLHTSDHGCGGVRSDKTFSIIMFVFSLLLLFVVVVVVCIFVFSGVGAGGSGKIWEILEIWD